MPWIESDYEEATLEGLQVVERYWRRYIPCYLHPQSRYTQPNFLSDYCRYCTHVNVDHKTALLSEEPAIYINFIDWIAMTSLKRKKQTYDEY